MSRGFFTLLVGIILAAGPVFALDSVTFTFRPPANGITLLRTEQTTEADTLNLSGETLANAIVTTTQRKIEIVKTSSGYTWTETVVAHSEMENGKNVDSDPESQIGVGIPLILQLDSRGQLYEVKGCKEYYDKVAATLDGKELAEFKKFVTPDTLARMVQSGWMTEVKPFLGQTKSMDDTWKWQNPEPLFAEKLVPVTSTFTVQQILNEDKQVRVLVNRTASPDLQLATADLQIYIEKQGYFKQGVKPVFTVPSYTIDSTVEIDPALTIPMKETSTVSRTYKATAKGRYVIGTQKLEYTSTTQVLKDVPAATATTTQAAPGADSITFAIKPPAEGYSYTQTERQIRSTVQTNGQETLTNVTVIDRQKKIDFAKTATGFTITETALTYAKKKDGKPQDTDPVTQAMLNQPIVFELDADCRLVAIKGIEQLYQRACDQLKGPALESFQKSVTAAMLDDVAREGWKRDYSAYLGMTRKAGDTWKQEENTLLFSAQAPVNVNYTLEKVTTEGGMQGGIVKSTASPDLIVAAGDLQQTYAKAGIFPAEMNPNYSVVSYKIDTTGFIDACSCYPMRLVSTMMRTYIISANGRAVEMTDTFETTVKTVPSAAPAGM